MKQPFPEAHPRGISTSARRRMTGLLAGLLLIIGWVICWAPVAEATQVPAGVRNYLFQKDPDVKIRFDGLVIFSNGESYLPVIPQESPRADAMQVIHTSPKEVDYPDLIQFDNDYFLLRLVLTDRGRLTLPKLPDYPVSLLEGLLPQDLVLPPNLFIPVELKVILGALPYHPEFDPAAPPPVSTGQALPKSAEVLQAPAEDMRRLPRKPVQDMLFVYNVNEHRLVAVEPETRRMQGSINLGCVPSRIKADEEGRLLFVACLTTDELLVVDTSAKLVKTRIKVGSKPEDILLFNEGQEVLISHRFSKFISRISTQELMEPRMVQLPAPGGAMTVLRRKDGEGNPRVLVADAFAGKVYQVNILKQAVEKTFNVLPNVSALWVSPNTTELWVTSRTQNRVQVISLASGAELESFEVGKKPVDMKVSGENLYVLTAQADALEVFDWRKKKQLKPIRLSDGMFPSSMVMTRDKEYPRAYVVGAGADGMSIVSLGEQQLFDRLDLPIRATLVALAASTAGDKDKEVSEEDPAALSEQALSEQALMDEADAVSLEKADKEAVGSEQETDSETSSAQPKVKIIKPGRPDVRPATRGEAAQAPTKPLSLPALEENVLK